MLVRARFAFLLLAFSACAYASKLPTSFDGYVTNVAWPDSFDVGTRHVKFDRESIHYSTPPQQEAGLDESLKTLLRVGALVHVDGEFTKGSSDFVASTIGFQPFPGDSVKELHSLDGTGPITEKPILSRESDGIAGQLWIDGYPLWITPKTRLLSRAEEPKLPKAKNVPGT